MNDANIATYDVYEPEMRCDAADGAMKSSIIEMHPDRQVREDKGFYIPDLKSDGHYDANSEAYSFAADHAEHLYKAQGLVGDALNLVGMMLASLGDESDSRAMQSDTALKVIEKKLKKAYNRIDQHDARHTNLFLAYFDLRQNTSGNAN